MGKSIYSEEQRKLTKRIRAARFEKGFSQKDLAEKLGQSQSYVSKLEAGQSKIEIFTLKKLSKILGKNIGYFIKE